MSKRSEIAALTLLVLLPLAAAAGVVADKSKAAPAREPAANGRYVLRCWQEGRLIVEEQHVSAPQALESAAPKLQLLDRHRQPLYIAETRNATCMVRALPPARPRSTLP